MIGYDGIAAHFFYVERFVPREAEISH